MVRAGEGGYLIEQFEKGSVTVGWHEAGEITDKSQRDLWLRLAVVYPASKSATNQNAASVLWRFAKVIKVGDTVVTYDPTKREYLVGEITSDYRFQPKRGDHPHGRDVSWHHRVSRDLLSVPTRNSLGSTLALFAIAEEATKELHLAAKSTKPNVEAGGLESRKDRSAETRQGQPKHVMS